MIDTLLKHRSRFKQPQVWNEVGLKGGYIVITLHRPSNVDEEETLKLLLNEIIEHT